MSEKPSLPVPAGRPDPADPVLPRLPQDPEPAHLPQPGGPLRAHQPAPPHGRGQEAQTQLLTGRGLSCPSPPETFCFFSKPETRSIKHENNAESGVF